MDIGLLGYGKMGKEIETIARKRGHHICLIVDENNRYAVTENEIKECEVLIDFSTPDAVIENIHWVMHARVPLVVGTTGWHHKLEEVKKVCEQNHGSLIYGSNFSVGVNIFFALNKYLAGIMENYHDYTPSIHEVHHTQKLDAPSGTAITLAQDLMGKISRKKSWVNYTSRDAAELAVTSERLDQVPGTHIITYQSEVDTIELKHTAHNRQGFALGAVMAAEWIKGKTGIYEVKQMFGF